VTVIPLMKLKMMNIDLHTSVHHMMFDKTTTVEAAPVTVYYLHSPPPDAVCACAIYVYFKAVIV